MIARGDRQRNATSSLQLSCSLVRCLKQRAQLRFSSDLQWEPQPQCKAPAREVLDQLWLLQAPVAFATASFLDLRPETARLFPFGWLL